jgi:hypothetical protein
MKVLYKFKKCFCSFKFQRILKDIDTIRRLDKINIFEYFDIIEERKTSKPEEYLVKEIADYLNSNLFKNEFKFTISTQEQKFKFLILNLSLLTNRLQHIHNEEKKNLKLSNFSIFDFNSFLLMKKIIFLFQYIPFKFYCREVIKMYSNKNQIKDKYNYIVENELLKRFNKKDYLYSKTKRNFLETLDQTENEEEIFTKIKEKFVRDFLLKDESSQKSKSKKDKQDKEDDGSAHVLNNDCEKLALFLIAHVNTIFNF